MKPLPRPVLRAIPLAILTLAAAGPLVADEGQFYLAPGVQWMNFNDAVKLGNDEGLALGLGYDISDRVSVELNATNMEPEVASGPGDTDFDHWRLDFLFDLERRLGVFDTFAVTGLGENDFQFHEETVWDLGAGIRYALTDRLEWRVAARSFFSLDEERTDIGIDTALIFRFGGARRAVADVEPAPRHAVGDADQDGVPDDRDACPDTPRTYAVDDRGCPIPIEEVARIDLKVNFDFDRSEVKAEYFDEIQQVADFMRQYPDVIAELEGHTDSVGTEAYNQGLSERRVNAVRQVLVDRFSVQASRISAVGYGESRPATTNDTDAGRAENRRVITVILKTLQNYQPR